MDANLFKNPMAITIQNTISKLGPIPDDCGDQIKEILQGNDVAAFLALGVYLEEATESDDYEILQNGLEDIKRGQERKKSMNEKGD